jgi:4-alpha-glucanotransferase
MSTMANKVSFCLVIHNHQPVGNFGHVFEQAYKMAYKPFLDMLADYPAIKISIHNSGCLLDWIEKNKPEYIERLAALAAEGRVEIIGGGYYEPILSIIPRDDAAMQLTKMKNHIHDIFGKQPKGIWLTERIWEPGLPEVLAENDVEYTLLDESHFLAAGIDKDRMTGHYITEKYGHKVNVFPIRKDLRYAIPFAEPHRTVEILRHLADLSPGACVTYGDDGEKFGIWPKTYEWVYEKQWLKRFFDELTNNADWIQFKTLSEVYENTAPTGRVYLPATSYHEMTQWALPTSAGIDLERIVKELKTQNKWEDYGRFIRGGYWDNFLTKYTESNRLHKRMLRVSRKVAKCPEGSLHTDLAQSELMAGQCNCAYWHGLFGGLHLNYLRDAVMRHLSRAETYADLLNHGNSADTHFETYDYDADGFDEALLESPFFRIVVKPTDGAVIEEIILVREDFCISNVLTRRPEIYHDQVRHALTTNSDDVASAHDLILAKEKGLADHIHYDRHIRANFRDRLFHSLPDMESTIRDNCEEIPGLSALTYAVETTKGKDGVFAKCTGVFNVQAESGPSSIAIEKCFTLSLDEPLLKTKYRFRNESQLQCHCQWGVELNLTLLAGSAPDRKILVGDKEFSPSDIFEEYTSSVVLIDGWQNFRFEIDFHRKLFLRSYPVESVSQSESGFERNYQGTCLTAYSPIEIAPGACLEYEIVMKIAPTK